MNDLIKRPGLDFFNLPIPELVDRVRDVADAYQAKRIAGAAEAVIQDKKGELRILEVQAAKETRPGKLAALRELIKGSVADVNKAILVKTLYRRRAGELLPEPEEMNKGRPRKASPNERLSPTYADLGFTNYEDVARLRRLAAASIDDLVAWCDEKTKRGVELTSKLVDKYMLALLAKDPEDIGLPGEPNCTLIQGDFRFAKVADESIDVIVTDPPYVTSEKEYLELYRDLSIFAARVLKPGGSLYCMSGQLYLFQVMRGLGKELQYHWTIAIVMKEAGQCPRINNRKVNTLWKPLLWFTKGEASYDHIETSNPRNRITVKDSDGRDKKKQAPPTQWVGDVVAGGKRPEQEFHLEGWQQSDETMNEIVRKYTNRGSIICDPMMGSGTTGIAAISQGRSFVGIEIEEEQFKIAKLRLKEGI